MLHRHLLLFLLTFLLSTTPVLAGVYDDILAAAENGRTEEVISLLQRGMDVNTTDRDGSSLLLIAARTGNVPLTDFLLNNRAHVNKPNRYGDMPLHLAVSQGHLTVVEKLLTRGAEINPPGWTPLHYAVFADNLPIARLLLKHGAGLDHRAPNGRTALMLSAQLGRSTFGKLLLEAGADRTLKDYEGMTAASIARQKEFADMVELLENGN